MLSTTLDKKIVLCEVNTILAASIKEHKNYKDSKALLDCITSTNQQDMNFSGIITPTVKSQARNTLSKALHDTLKTKLENLENRNLNKVYHHITKKLFVELLRKLKTCQISYKLAQKIKKNEITPMYEKILKKKVGKPIISLCSSWRLRSTVNRIEKEKKDALKNHLKRKSIIPGETDKTILSEAVYLKREVFQTNKMYLVSWDKHFSGDNAFYREIPERIRQVFGITCLTPKQLLGELTHCRINN